MRVEAKRLRHRAAERAAAARGGRTLAALPGGNGEVARRPCAVACRAANLAEQVLELGLETASKSVPLLGDSSGDAGWRAWHKIAGFPYRPIHSALTIPDSHSRVQAVIDGQGLALWDDLVAPEYQDGKLKALTKIHLRTSGYFIIFPELSMTDRTADFVAWLRTEAQGGVERYGP